MAVYRNQIGTIETTAHSQFYRDVLKGLSSTPKHLPSKYFYDAEGDRLFQHIMLLPEYYLSRSELEIFSLHTAALAAPILKRFREFDVLELGAGDATKSTHLLRYLYKSGRSFTYYPVDISRNIIHHLEDEMPKRIPGLRVHGLKGDFFEKIRECAEISNRSKFVMFLGSTIGNFTPGDAKRFLMELNDQLQPGDLVLIGFDLRKNPRDILAAYNDRFGVTKAFNMNLLTRINQELNGNFDLSKFDHYPTYDPISGACKSYLVSMDNQEVQVGGETFTFYQNEPAWTELSQKYSEQEIQELVIDAGFTTVADFYDCRHWFLDTLLEKGL